MTFVHHWYLLGLGAALVPLLLHIIHTRRIRKVQFSTLHFLKMIHRQRSLRIRLSRLLLLLARMGMVALICCAFAQPYFTSPTFAYLNPGPRLVALVWDNAGSTRATDGRQTVMERMRTMADAFLSTLAARDTLVVVTTSPVARVIYRGGARDFDPARLPGATASSGDRARAVEMVQEAYRTTSSIETWLAIFSDFRKAAWPQELTRSAKANKVALFPAALHAYHNWGISRVEVTPPAVAVGEPVVLTITLNYFSTGEQRSTSLGVKVDGKVLDNRIMAASVEPIRTQLALSGLKEGLHRITLSLSPDALGLDNDRQTQVRVLPHRRILIVNGKKRATPAQDEGYFLRRVVGTPTSPRRGFQTREIFELTEGEDLTEHQLVVLAGVKTISPQVSKKLSRYVSDGGAVLVFLSENVDPASYNASVLPWFGFELSRRVEQGGALKVAEGVAGPLEEILDPTFWQSVAVDRYYLLTRKAKLEGVLAPVVLPDGTPALSVSTLGAGTAVLVNTSAGTESGDLPLHPIYPALVSACSRLSTGAGLEQYPAGQRIVFSLGESDLEALLSIQAPDGKLTALKPSHGSTSLQVVFDDTHRPGIYHFVRRAKQHARTTPFLVVPPSQESDLTTIPAAELVTRFPGALVSEPGRRASNAAAVRVTAFLTLADILIFLAIALVIVELFLVWDLERQILYGAGETYVTPTV
ncbi:MAG: BatA domain-containing protein [Candidatus Riflebacteria bacterium]|nr:BatA domain-containing protein [Candidatus Riflebacteria bacterium]